MSTNPDIALYIDPPSHHFLGDRLFDLESARLNGDNLLAPYIRLRQAAGVAGIEVHTADCLLANGGARTRNLYVSLGRLSDLDRFCRRDDTVLSAFIAMECPIVEPSLYRRLGTVQHHFKRIYSWSDSASLERFVGSPLRCIPFRWPQSFDTVHAGLWAGEDRGFLVMINANKLPRLYWQELYTERIRAAAFFARHGEIDLYGMGWDAPPYRMGRGWIPGSIQHLLRGAEQQWRRWRPDPVLEAARRAYRGPAESKSATLGRYRFAVCFENMILNGWITEKIFDCFYVGTIPIYWGAPDIDDHVPAECFIDMRRFDGYDDLRRYLHSLGTREIRRYRETARQFVASPRFRPFSTDAFVDLFRQIVAEDTGVTF
jgi:hypothetical protein